MSVLSDFENRVSRAVEGVFAGVFRAPVQPAELAKACGKEMDRGRKLGVGKVYAPTLYSILLSPADGDQLGGFAHTLGGELETYLMGYAREHDYQLSTRPRVRFLIDDDLKLGRFEIIGELLSAEEIAADLGDDFDDADVATPAPERFRHGAAAAEVVSPTTTLPAADALELERHPEPGLPRTAAVVIRGTEQEITLALDRYVLGRLNSCDICLPDANASREHAMIERDGTGWALVDLGSTNGTLINGLVVDRRVRLREGDVITVGITELVYREARS